jgi:acetolactate synthase I/II/III large subunit
VIPPAGDPGALDELARMLVAAENPVLICGRVARTPLGMQRVVELAETLQCAVIDDLARLNFPNRHPLNARGTDVLGGADLVVALEVDDVYGSVHILRDRIVRATAPILKPGAKLVTIRSADLYMKSNYQDFQRYQPVDLAIAGDAEESLPVLTELVKKRLDPPNSTLEARGKKLAEAHQDVLDRTRRQATIGWDASPITTSRLCAELYAQIANLDWSLVASGIYPWPHGLWNFDKPHRWIGDSGGSGIGYLLPASTGAALANKAHGRFSVCIQPDGDFMFVPSTLWMAAHHRIPILYVMHNNRAYHQEYMYLQAMANRRQRGIDKAYIGTTFRDPYVDFATVARGFGVHGEGPITDPKELGSAIARAIAVVRSGEPALVDVVTDPR